MNGRLYLQLVFVTGISFAKVLTLSDFCRQEPDVGNCRAILKRWFYNQTSRSCKVFYYGGCNGNENRFETKDQCNKACRDPDYGICAKPQSKGTCRESKAEVRVRFNADKRICESYSYEGCRAEENSFKSYEDCYKNCNDFVTNPCVLPIIPAPTQLCPGGKSYNRFGYNTANKKCESFIFSDCNGNKNSFSTRLECLQTCANNSMCLQQTQLNKWRPFASYFYDKVEDKCKKTTTFLHKAKWPHSNRFSTVGSCQQHCMPSFIPRP